MDNEFPQIDETYHEHHGLILQLRDNKLKELLVKGDLADDEIVRGELRRRKDESEASISHPEKELRGATRSYCADGTAEEEREIVLELKACSYLVE